MAFLRPPKIDEIKSPPVIGKTYRVPSVRRGDVIVPVLAPAHTDVELGNHVLHFHVDTRFISDDDAVTVGLNVADFDIDPEAVRNAGSFDFPVIRGHCNEIVKINNMKCIRVGPNCQTTRILSDKSELRLNAGTRDQTGRLEDIHENDRVTKCGKCPHRGTPLGHQPVVDGVVVCPAHLLKWDKATGKMIRKTKKLADGTYAHA